MKNDELYKKVSHYPIWDQIRERQLKFTGSTTSDKSKIDVKFKRFGCYIFLKKVSVIKHAAIHLNLTKIL